MKDKVKDIGPGIQAFTTIYPGLVRRIISDIGISAPFKTKDIPPQIDPPYYTHAMWDTGATGSVITQTLAQKLNLTATGSVMVNHAGGRSPSNTYIVNLYLPNKVLIPGVPVIECPDTVGDFSVIIGMDIICSGDFAITNYKGITRVSFESPSNQIINFVEQINSIKYSGIGRNSPCPCGSGKKFKNCCRK